MAASDELDGFIAKYTPEIAACAHEALAEMRAFLPGAVEMVYDNYNALAIGFGPTDRTSGAVFSIVLYPRWVTLFILDAVHLPDPQKLLRGNGKRVRHIVLERGAATLRDSGVRALMQLALAESDPPFDATQPGRIVIKSISANQRARRPAASVRKP